MKKLLALSTLTLALTASSMMASIITDPSVPPGTINAPGTFDFSTFNPALGTLTQITINLSTSVNTTLNVFNPTGGPLAFTTASVSVPFALTFTGGTGTFNFSGTATDTTGAIVAGGMLFTESVLGTSTTSFNITPFTGYVGAPGTFTPTFTLGTGGSATASGTGSQSLLYGGSGTGSVVASITYTYTAASTAPEPATMTLFGSALLGIGFFARKRIVKKS
jgi:hypothetical protein